MPTEYENTQPDLLKIRRNAWKTRAAAQGLLCFVCKAIPALEWREHFYDTGLCRACAQDLGRTPSPGVG